jgi:hypothetical protein
MGFEAAMKRFVKAILVLFVGFVLLAAAFLALAAWMMNGHGADLQAFEQVTNGMSMAEVEALMGRPETSRVMDDQASSWKYGSTWKWCAMQVCFGTNRLVEAKIHDH